MRYISLVFIVFLMWWTWSVIETPSALSEETHVGLQEDLRRIITDYIKENVEGASDVSFERFWTQALKENQVKTTFSYSFDETSTTGNNGTTRIGVDGYAILNRTKEQNTGFDVWSLDELNVLNNRVIFKEGITVNGALSTDR